MALRTAKARLPLTAFCADVRDWRRLTALWKAHLADDDWARILESLALNDSCPDIPTLIHIHNVNPNVEEDLADFVVEDHEDHHLALMLDEGRLVGDPHLQGAAAVLALLRSSIGDEGGETGTDVLIFERLLSNSKIVDRLGIEDLAWVFRSGDLSADQQTMLATRLRSDPRLRRALADAMELTEQLDGSAPAD